ncbi:hypothetical protein QBZ16_001000 [Prototheca wickerhamii]|uniref:Proteasome subunit beta n=1 Tax=Prototheca wickerhamii TaxID=3111 RepID=A0AAD9IH14_PROWI|nr:hypothetical protein QBZ16_001000 [Prototheca wickerhamii]
MAEAPGGFNFDLVQRNALLEQKGMKGPGFTKTGTTIAGIIFKDGVVLGADTRSTAGTTVADKNCEKIHYIAPNIYCCGAGTAADTENVTGMISSQLELHRYGTGRDSRVVTAMTLLKSHLFKCAGGGIYPHGSTDSLPYCTMGSGSLNAMSVFESGYKDGLDRDEAVELVTRAIRAGIYNDLGSGSNVDICVITKDKVDYLRNHQYLQGKPYERLHPMAIPAGNAPVIATRRFDVRKYVDVGPVPEAMEIA